MKAIYLGLIMLTSSITIVNAQDAKYYPRKDNNHLKFIGTWVAKLNDKLIKITFEYKVHHYLAEINAYSDVIVGSYSILDRNNNLAVGDKEDNIFTTAMVFVDDPYTLEAAYLDRKNNVRGDARFLFEKDSNNTDIFITKGKTFCRC